MSVSRAQRPDCNIDRLSFEKCFGLSSHRLTGYHSFITCVSLKRLLQEILQHKTKSFQLQHSRSRLAQDPLLGVTVELQNRRRKANGRSFLVPRCHRLREKFTCSNIQICCEYFGLFLEDIESSWDCCSTQEQSKTFLF